MNTVPPLAHGPTVGCLIAALLTLASFPQNTPAASADPVLPGDRQIDAWFQHETGLLTERPLQSIRTLEDWNRQRPELHRQLLEMLGLDPLPERSPLEARVTGSIDHPEFTVEKLHFQSLPGLYVTANLYLPKALDEPAPAILYVCGHGPSIHEGVSYGNKVSYQHHGAWFARNGYVCLVIDTLQLGEIQGIHHGTYRESMWWWNARGYSPAGVEAWNSIRALDYLESRPEVDTQRFGVTGRSGGGAYSWWLAAADDRVKVAAPVAGITDLHNHVVDGVVEGHCDCMYVVNTHRWDYATVAALVAPRPLLIANSDKDSIFPLDGVIRLHSQVRRIYDLHGAGGNLGLLITEGPHKDTQDLRIPVFHWFNRHLKTEDPPIEMAAEKFFTPEQLKVFSSLPSDQINTRIHDHFIPTAVTPDIPDSLSAWTGLRDDWIHSLRSRVFAGWPADPGPLRITTAFSTHRDGHVFSAFDFSPQPHLELRLYILRQAADSAPQSATVTVLDEQEWPTWLAAMRSSFPDALTNELRIASSLVKPGSTDSNPETPPTLPAPGHALVWFAPRGIGLSGWNPDQRHQTHIHRRFMLLGQTLDGMRVWDIHRSLRAIRSLPEFADSNIDLTASRLMAVNAAYASLFETDPIRLILRNPSPSHQHGPIYLNVLKFLDVPQAIAMAAEKREVLVHTDSPESWEFPAQVAKNLDWPENRIQFRPRSESSSPTISGARDGQTLLP